MKSVHHHLPTKPFSIPCLKTSWVGGTKNWHLYDLAKGRVWNLIKTHFWWNWWNSFGDKAKNGHRTENVDFFCVFFVVVLVCADLKKNRVYFNCPLMMFKVFRHQLFFQCLRECWAPVWHQWNSNWVKTLTAASWSCDGNFAWPADPSPKSFKQQ